MPALPELRALCAAVPAVDDPKEGRGEVCFVFVFFFQHRSVLLFSFPPKEGQGESPGRGAVFFNTGRCSF